jgi:hypothetical protein
MLNRPSVNTADVNVRGKSRLHLISSGKLALFLRSKETMTVPDANIQISVAARAVLWKCPSIKNERASASLGASRYFVAEGTLDECMRQFMGKPINQHHLYEIHTAPQFDVVSAILSAKHIVELARLRDFL